MAAAARRGRRFCCILPAMRLPTRLLSTACAAALLACCASYSGSAGAERQLVVGAASSVTEALAAIADRFEQEHPDVEVLLSFAGSGVLRVQIERGAPIDVLVSASRSQMEPLAKAGRIASEDVVAVAENRLVLVAGRDADFSDLEGLLALPGALLALGDPVRVPAGEYAQKLIEERNLSARLLGRTIPAENVRQVLRYVETGVVAGGLVYQTDAAVSDQVIVLERFSEGEIGPIELVAAPILASAHLDVSRAFVAFLRSDVANDLWAAHGFEPIRFAPDETKSP